MTNWTLRDRGFLPTPDPLCALPERDHGGFGKIERIGVRLPMLLRARRLHGELDALPIFDYAAIEGPALDRVMRLYSYFGSAYVWADPQNPADHIPAGVAVPLVQLADRLARKPILSYASYCLTNWRRLDPAGVIRLGNLELLHQFLGSKDEAGFILVHTDIEARAAGALWACVSAQTAVAQDEPDAVADALGATARALAEMHATFARMPDECSADVYYHQVRPYIFSFTDVVYEGCFGNRPQSFRGETGAQSSIVPCLVAALGIEHKASILTRHLADLRGYMPLGHRSFIDQRTAGPSIRRFVQRADRCGLTAVYNDCVDRLCRFRTAHLDYAVTYIQQKVTNPTGTGGTPFVQWLSQLRDETERHLL